MIKMQLPSHTYQAHLRLKYEKTALRKIKWPRMHKVEMRIKVLIDANQHITIESLQSQFAGQTEKKAVIGFVTEKGIAMLILGWHYWRIPMAKRPKATF